MKQKTTYKLLGIASLIGFTFSAIQLIRLIRFNKTDKKSNFNGNLKSIVFTITNNTNQKQQEYLFDSRSGKDNPNVTVSSNLLAFNQELSNVPKLIKKIRFRTLIQPVVPGAAKPKVNKNRQAEAPFQMICSNADGTESVKAFHPYISAMQVQQGITTLKMNDYLINGECYMKYTIYPNSKLDMVVFYEDKPLSELLTK